MKRSELSSGKFISSIHRWKCDFDLIYFFLPFLRETVSEEHGITGEGQYEGTNDLQLERISVYYNGSWIFSFFFD